jgi:hypothetical protein
MCSDILATLHGDPAFRLLFRGEHERMRPNSEPLIDTFGWGRLTRREVLAGVSALVLVRPRLAAQGGAPIVTRAMNHVP